MVHLDQSDPGSILKSILEESLQLRVGEVKVFPVFQHPHHPLQLFSLSLLFPFILLCHWDFFIC